MPSGRKDSVGSRPPVVCSAAVQHTDIHHSSRSHNGKMSSSDHLVPIAPRMPTVHDSRFGYRPVMRQPGQQPMYPYHGMPNHAMAMHAASPYPAYYSRSMMMPSTSSTSDGMVNYNSPTVESHPHMTPVGVPAQNYTYGLSPWQAPNAASRKRKSTRSSVGTAEKDLTPEFEHADDQLDNSSVKSDKKKERSRNSTTSSKSSQDALSIVESHDIDAAPSTSAATASTSNERTAAKPEDEDSQRYQPATPSVLSDEEERVLSFRPKRALHALSQTSRNSLIEENAQQDQRRTPETDDNSLIAQPDNARRFPPGACKKVYSPTGSMSTSNDTDIVIEPLLSLYAPAGLDLADQVQHYKKTVASLHERLKKEHDRCRQVSSQRIRAEMMWEAVAQELRQLRVHLARLATQPLPTAMAGSMQLP